ncbi:hypothetical protein SCH01S_45_00740 [Sphingomonas changbaiensis NBRC 104936]|uniref:Uncharacterized protein n=1 Tax=Sphingomonas changbaiensis NBRC 104936 TaxID=1219043 RepID=A0A0E9MS25_9SPHN|nr:hypothetical protein [Sphingomonas changbaiensis]GAO40231.1 hypothetical protein SCH01S_45_00740 [Sphingomonas changbaiensis NBRC 104936]
MNDELRQRLNKFIGYGNPAGPVWFFGAEEGLGGKMNPQEQQRNLLRRCEWEPVMDMFEAHQTLCEAGEPIDISSSKRKGHTGVWRWMSRVARAFDGASNYLDATHAAAFMRNSLGRRDGSTFLTELRAIPAARSGSFQRSSGTLVEERRREQLTLLSKHQPTAVVCYGTTLKDDFSKHLEIDWGVSDVIPWVSAKGRLIRTVIYRANIRWEIGRTTSVFLLPFFGQGAMSGALLSGFVESGGVKRLSREPV